MLACHLACDKLGIRKYGQLMGPRLRDAQFEKKPMKEAHVISLGLQIAHSRYYLQTLDPKVGNICILGALGLFLSNKPSLYTTFLEGNSVSCTET